MERLNLPTYSFKLKSEEGRNLIFDEIRRKYVDFLDIDRPLYPDHTAMKELVKSCEILEEVEKLIGSLE